MRMKRREDMGDIFQLVINFAIVAVMFFIIATFRYYKKRPKGVKNIDSTREVKKIANIKEDEINSKKVYIIENKNETNPKATIIYLHGGAYVGGITNRHWNFINKLVSDTKLKIIFPDYPLAPKHTYQEVFNMLEEVYDKYKNEDNLIFMGDSAGGALSLALAQKLALENKKQPAKLILISPWLDISLKNEKIAEKEKEDKVLKRSVLKLAAEMYSNKTDYENYLLSPINGEIDKIKNVTIFTGTSDMLNPDVHILKEKFDKQKNNQLKVIEKEKATHNWIIEDMNAKEDYLALVKEILDFS